MTKRIFGASAIGTLALLATLAGCGGGGSGDAPTGPVLPPSGTAQDLANMISGSFVAGAVLPTNVDTTASLLATMNVNGLRAGLVLLLSPTTGLQDGGAISLRTGLAGSTSETALDKLQLRVSGLIQTVYTTLPSHPLGVVLPFDATTHHRFTVPGGTGVTAFEDSVLSVTLPAIASPAASATVSRAADLVVSWSNAGADTTVYCLALVRSQVDTTMGAISALVRDPDAQTTITTARLSTLPAGAARLALARFRLVHHSVAGGRKADLVSEAVETRSITLN